MCARYPLDADPEELGQAFGVKEGIRDTRVVPRFNIAPTQDAPVITNRDPHALQFFRWGLVPFWAKSVKVGYRAINAKAESIRSKPMFKEAFERRRCLVPATGFYEWREVAGTTQPYWFHLRGSKFMAFAGLWATWKAPDGTWLHSFTILTTEPNMLVAPVHDRMPVVLRPESFETWLKPDVEPADLEALLKPYASEDMAMMPVNTRLGSPKNEGRELLTLDVR